MFILLQYLFYFALTIISILIGLKLFFQPVKRTCKCTARLDGKVVLVTGGNSGIGLETARDMAGRGAKVIIASRNEKKSEAAVRDIISTTGNKNVEYRHLDLGKFKSIREFAEDINKNEERLDILVNNSGVGGLDNVLTEDNIDIVMQVNYFGHVLLTNLLLKKMEASAPSRIVNVSSNLHHIAYLKVDNLRENNVFTHVIRYGNSKLCIILWTKALAKKLPKGITTFSLHPGVVKTDVFLNLTYVIRVVVLTVIGLLFKTPVEGAQTTIHVCVAPNIEETSGGFYKECRLTAASRQARDSDFAEKVFNESMKVLDVAK
ncbi:unnamed protein product [Leptosia nina]|uniref:Retinol dehydrogenase 11 n=1 Tax=Leptosia nina TaxID=320188 RepID=A0AAV1J2H7_9NEOP